jgi:hypothetical protein
MINIQLESFVELLKVEIIDRLGGTCWWQGPVVSKREESQSALTPRNREIVLVYRALRFGGYLARRQ